jgi:hypothetical protein
VADRTGGADGGLDADAELEGVEAVEGAGAGRGDTDDAEREGPSFEATRAERSMKLLYSYFAARMVIILSYAETWILTSNKLLHLAVSFPIHQIRRRRVASFIRVVE